MLLMIPNCLPLTITEENQAPIRTTKDYKGKKKIQDTMEVVRQLTRKSGNKGMDDRQLLEDPHCSVSKCHKISSLDSGEGGGVTEKPF